MNNSEKNLQYHLNQYQPNMPKMDVYDMEEYLKKYDKKMRKLHLQRYFQILWFKTGKGRYVVDSTAHDIGENTIFFVTKNQVHYFDKNTNYEGIVIHFNEQFLTHNNNESNFFLNHDLFKNADQLPYSNLNSVDTFILEDYINLIKSELSNKNGIYQVELLRAYLKAFIIQVQHRKDRFQQLNGLPIIKGEKKKLILAKFVHAIEENYTKELKISEYAALLSVSTRTLSHLTNQLLDKSPSQMIHERIILEAKKMLLQANYNINQIGCVLGFGDASYFVKYFKKYTEISPSEFRNLAD